MKRDSALQQNIENDPSIEFKHDIEGQIYSARRIAVHDVRLSVCNVRGL